MFLPIVTLLMRVILGYPETDGTISDAIQLENEGNDALDIRAQKSATDASTDWQKEEPFSTLGNRKQTDPTDIMAGWLRRGSEHPGSEENRDNYRQVRGIGANAKIVTKRRERVGSWHDSQAKDKGIQNPVDDKKDPRIYWWGDKRISLYRSSPSIHRPIRVPFNGWGGKRGNYFPFAESKSMDNANTVYDIYRVIGEVEFVKTPHKTTLEKLRGKRARKEPADQEPDRQQFVLIMGSPNLNDDAQTVFDATKDKFAKGGEFGQEADRKQVFDKWDNKHNYFPYQFPLHAINRTTEQDYMTEGEITNNSNNNNDDDNDNWLMSMPDKRVKDGQVQKAASDSWDNIPVKKYTFGLENVYHAVLLPRNRYFMWGG